MPIDSRASASSGLADRRVVVPPEHGFGWLGPRSEQVARDAIRRRDDLIVGEDPTYRPRFCSWREWTESRRFPSEATASRAAQAVGETDRLDGKSIGASADLRPTGQQAADQRTNGAPSTTRHVTWETTERRLGPAPPIAPFGDAVARSIAVALADLLAARAEQTGEPRWAWRPFVPWLYGIGRVYLGGRLRGDGTLTAWTVEAATRLGVIPADEADLPEESALVTRRWGSSRRTLDVWQEKAMPGLLGPVVTLRSWEELVQAMLGDGMTATLASLQGFETIEHDTAVGKTFAQPRGSWPHQHAIRGLDLDPRRPAVFLTPSWGPIVAQLDGPEEGYWLDAEALDDLLRRSDTFLTGYLLATGP